MYRVIRVLNNNGVLAFDEGKHREVILLGKGVGFGRRTGERFERIAAPDVKRYELVTKEISALKQVNSIDPIFIEATARIIDEAEKTLGELKHDILLPMADHIALAVSRARENRELPNPFKQDIQALFEEEYQAALAGKEILLQMTGAEISDDEAAYITLHIHAGRSEENVADAMNMARLIQDAIRRIEQQLGMKLEADSLGYNRLLSHMRYMVARTLKNEHVNLNLEDYARENFPRTYEIAGEICSFMQKELKRPIAREEIGFLAIHIQRVSQGDQEINESTRA